jgi:PKD repeat protein
MVNGTNMNNLVWNFGDGTGTNGSSPNVSHTYADTGTYSVRVEVYSDATCGDTLLLPDTVHVHIVPTAAFTYSLNETVEPENGTVLFNNGSLNSTTYLWNFGDGGSSTAVNPSHLFPDIDSFKVVLTAYSQYGCLDSVDTVIYVVKKSLYVPNAFAPEFNAGSNLVQVWKPAGMGLLDYHAQIFDKWGELLWESTLLTTDHQPAEGWDGRYQGVICAQGVYVWKIDATFITGQRWEGMSYKFQEERKTIGSVTLIR